MERKALKLAQDSNWAWACNECGTQEFTSALSEIDLDYLACSNCGGDEFHKKALAQPAQKPKSFTYNEVADAMNSLRKGNSVQKAYAEEVGKLKLYAAPPQRPWVGLTDGEIDAIYLQHHNQYDECESPNWGYERAIEAKLKEKNT